MQLLDFGLCALEPRRMFSGRTLTIQGGDAPNEEIDVRLGRPRIGIGIIIMDNNVVTKQIFIKYSRRTTHLVIQAGFWNASGGTHGDHTINVSVDHDAGVKDILVKGVSGGINRININQNTTSVPVEVDTGNDDLNFLTSTGLSNGKVTFVGGKRCTTYFNLGAKQNVVVGGSDSSNISMLTATGTFGSITAGSNSSDIFETWDGKPDGYTIFGNVEIQQR